MADSPEPKAILRGTTLHSYASDASGTLRYYLDFGDPVADEPAPDASKLADAMNASGIPKIGQTTAISSVSGASTSIFSTVVHTLRVSGIHVVPTDNPFKYFIDVDIASRPQPSFEFGSSGTQTKGNTYLSGGTIFQSRKQMVIEWLLPKGTYGQDANGITVPSEDQILPRMAVTGNALRFGATCRLSATYYNDELSRDDLLRMNKYFVPVTNADDLFFQGDKGYWLCSSCASSSTDGGYSSRVVAELVFNPDGWDTVGVYTFMGNAAILTDAVVNAITDPLRAVGGPIPTPIVQSGAGRWPQVRQIELTPLKNLLYQNVLAATNTPAQIAAPIIAAVSDIQLAN